MKHRDHDSDDDRTIRPARPAGRGRQLRRFLLGRGPARPRRRRVRVLAVASGGGHFVQLRRLLGSLCPGGESDCDIACVTTIGGYEGTTAARRTYRVCDASQRSYGRLLVLGLQTLLILLWERPQVVISTGAAPGYVAVRLGRLLGARCVWVDSMANAEKVSLSGRRAARHCGLYLTQWPHLARPEGPRYVGAVL